MKKLFFILLASLVLGLGAFVLLRSPAPSPRFQAPSQEGGGISRKLKLEIPVPTGAHKYFSKDFYVYLDFGPRDIGSIFLGAPKVRGAFLGGVITAEFPLSPEVEGSLKGRPIWVRPYVQSRDVVLNAPTWAVSWEKIKLGEVVRVPQSMYMEFNPGSGSAGCVRASGEVTLDARVSDAAKKHIKPADEFRVYLLEARCALNAEARPCTMDTLDQVVLTGKSLIDAGYRFKVYLKGHRVPGGQIDRFWVTRICGPGLNSGECISPSAYLGSKVYPELTYHFQWEAGRVPNFCGSEPVVPTTIGLIDSSGAR